MVINFVKTLENALAMIGIQEYHEFNVAADLEETETIKAYGKAKWGVVDTLNQHYSHILEKPVDLYNWLNYNEEDEVSYFLSETGSNAFSYSDFRKPSKLQLWRGREGFVVGMQQEGKGFNAIDVDTLRQQENEGAAFDFFRKSKSVIFFDNPREARVVYMQYLF
jgi:hypothetical protein